MSVAAGTHSLASLLLNEHAEAAGGPCLLSNLRSQVTRRLL